MQTFVGFVALAIIAALGILGFQAGGQASQVVTLLLTAGVGLLAWKVQDDAKQAQALEERLRSDKKAIYAFYIDLIRDLLEPGTKGDDPKLVARLRKWSFANLLSASDEVVLAHDRSLHASTKLGDKYAVPAMADIILAMRRDVADTPTNLRLIDILGTMVTAADVEEMRALCDEWEREKAKSWPLTREPAAKR